jgi:uncharacterized protein (TIGR02118 family)
MAATGESKGTKHMIKMTLLYGRPVDPEAFEAYYSETHLPIAAKVSGIARAEFSKVKGTPDGDPPPYYRIAELWFDDAERMERVMATPEARRTVEDLPNFATGGVTTLISEVD